MHKLRDLYVTGLLGALALSTTLTALADPYTDALNAPGRPAADAKRDAIDHPAEVLRLAGIRRGMQVADFLAADGYYSELLSHLVGRKGHVYLLNNEAYDQLEREWLAAAHRAPAQRHAPDDRGRAHGSAGALPRCHPADQGLSRPVLEGRQGTVAEVDPAATLDEIARIVKPGGILLLVDHSAKPGTGSADAGSIHRIDEAFARQDFEQHGFVFVKSSDMLRRPDDARDKITYEGEMVGKTDRFVMVFRRAG